MHLGSFFTCQCASEYFLVQVTEKLSSTFKSVSHSSDLPDRASSSLSWCFYFGSEFLVSSIVPEFGGQN